MTHPSPAPGGAKTEKKEVPGIFYASPATGTLG